MRLKLTRPLVFFDLETTGLNICSDRIVEISYYKLFPNGNKESKTYRVNPEIPIPAVSTVVHGITDDDVRNCPTFKQIAGEIVKTLEGCDMAGYNSNQFDIPLLAEELIRANINFDLKRCRLVDSFVIFTKKEQRTLTAAYKFYCGKSLEKAHSANADTEATVEILMAQLDKYPDLPNSIDQLSQYTTYNQYADFAGRIAYDNAGNEIFNFGKYKGQKVAEVLKRDSGYYGWLINSNFPQYTKKIITQIYLSTKR